MTSRQQQCDFIEHYVSLYNGDRYKAAYELYKELTTSAGSKATRMAVLGQTHRTMHARAFKIVMELFGNEQVIQPVSFSLIVELKEKMDHGNKLTTAEVWELSKLLEQTKMVVHQYIGQSTETPKKLAAMFDMSRSHVLDILTLQLIKSMAEVSE